MRARAFGLGVGSEEEAAVHLEMRLCKKVGSASIHHQKLKSTGAHSEKKTRNRQYANLTWCSIHLYIQFCSGKKRYFIIIITKTFESFEN